MAKIPDNRAHVIYRITCGETGDTYIGLTVVRKKRPVKSAERRWKDHLYQAFVEGRDFPLHRLIRQVGPESFTHRVLHQVRGKSEAHKCELLIIKRDQPSLNVTGK
jgi:hypothetical protein